MGDCLFCNMVQGKMQVEKLYEDALVFSIRDIPPRAPVHIMVIPKQHVASALDLADEHGPLLGRLFAAAARVAREEGLDERGHRRARHAGGNAGRTAPPPPL